jgi:hypothetical protein
MSAPIHRHIRTVERELSALDRALGPLDYGDISGWHRRRAAETTAMCERLAQSTGARVTERWDGARVRIDGIAATSTTGAASALRNWLKKAKERA